MVQRTVVDVVVLGMGPGSEDAAGRLAEAGLEVVGIERRLLGGECPYWGCVPSKMMVRAADLLAEGRRIPGMAGDATVRPDYAPVASRIRDATDDWDDKVAVDRFVGKGGRFVRGHGTFTGRREVTVGDETFEARRGVVVNIGTSPSIPPIDGLSGTPYWTNREAVEAQDVPDSLIVLGGGTIGLELAQAFARFGSAVSIIEMSENLLSSEEPEAGKLLVDVLRREGVDIRTGVSASSVRFDGGQFTVAVGDDKLVTSTLLVATGREADISSLGLREAGYDVDPDTRFLDVDEHLRVDDGLWAMGDATGKGAFTHVAMYQSPIVVRSILGEEGPGADYHALPRVTFTDPEIGAVGLTEAQARERDIDVRTAVTEVPSSSRGWIHGPGNDGFIKLVENASRGVLVGATSAGPVGGEVLGALTVAVHADVPTTTLRQMMYAYPTFHRAIETALQSLG